MADRAPGATLGWVAAALGGVLLALASVTAGGAFLLAADGGDDGSDDSLRLAMVRSDLEVASLDVIVGRLLVALDEPGDHEARIRSAAAAMRDAVDELDELQQIDSSIGWAARQLLDAVDVGALDDPARGDLDELFDVADDARYLALDAEMPAAVAAFSELSFVEALPWHILIEAVAGMADVADLDVADDARPFVDRMTVVVRTEGGWLAADPPTALAESPWFEIDQARARLPRATERAETAVAESDLREVDRWALDLGSGSAAAPVDPGTAAALADDLRTALAPIVDAAGDATISAIAVESADDGPAPWAWLSLAGALALGGVVLLVLGVRDIRSVARFANERAEMAVRDALTGVGNRHLLADLERSLADDSRFDRHVVAIVDLDRFKMVNDLHGHAAGDAVLVAVAARLEDVALSVSRSVHPSEHAVIRLGGDEFLLAIHAARPIDVDRLRGGLELCRRIVIDVGGERIPLEFSIGIAESSGRCRLDELMREADLAVYAEKAARTADRRLDPPLIRPSTRRAPSSTTS